MRVARGALAVLERHRLRLGVVRVENVAAAVDIGRQGKAPVTQVRRLNAFALGDADRVFKRNRLLPRRERPAVCGTGVLKHVRVETVGARHAEFRVVAHELVRRFAEVFGGHDAEAV